MSINVDITTKKLEYPKSRTGYSRKGVSFINFLKDIQVNYNITNAELATQLDISLSHLKNVLNGKRRITNDLQQKIDDLVKQYERHYSLDCKVDWINVQFNSLDAKTIIEQVLKIKFEWFSKEKTNEFNYGTVYRLERLKLLVAKENFESMGSLITLSGSACRLLERFLLNQKRTWLDFFQDCINLSGKFTRVDLAVDDYVEYLPLREMLVKIEKNELETRFKRITPHYTIEYEKESDSDVALPLRTGVTIYFGTRQSKLQICLYQKNYELAKKQNKSVSDFDIKNRYEVRFKEEYAEECVAKLLEKKDVYDVTLGVMMTRITLLNSDKKTVWKSWEKLMLGVERIDLRMEPAVKSYEKMVRYFKESFGRTLKTLMEIDEQNHFTLVEDTLFDLELSSKYKEVIAATTSNVQKMIVDDWRYKHESKND